MGGSVIRNHADYDGGHKFLAEELLQPMTNKCDVGRTNMFTSHISQTVVLDEPERPRVFSRFENAFGAYTTAVKVLPQDATVLAVFEKNPLQKVYAIQYADGKVDIHFSAPVRHLTENYGYRLTNTALEGVEPGQELKAGTQVQGWACTDDDGNFRYGVNLKTVYMNLEGRTYEDGIVCSESAAERLSHTSIDKVTVVLNANDLTVNLYGTADEHQGFPDVGEAIKNGVLLARRRINHESILFDLSAPQLGKVNWDSDTVLYSEGTVVDVDVFSNLSADELDKHPFNRQILAYHSKWMEFREWFMEVFGDAVRDQTVPYSDDVAYWYRVCRDTGEGGWRHERSEFDGVVIRFTIAKRNKLGVGSKITNRYGGKGVISKIKPDAEMPATEDGRRADLVINSLGVVNRLNPAQLFESELNFIADKVAVQMREMDDGMAYGYMVAFLDTVSPAQADWMRENLDEETIAELVAEIKSGKEPIYIHQPPFFGNVSLEKLALAYENFGVEKEKFVGIEEPLVLGTNYYMKLRHEPSSKMSARSAKHLSIGGVPTKNSRGVRTNTEHHSTTPIRLGEQELQNLLIANAPDELKRFLRIYATDDVSREGAIAELLTRPDPFSSDRIEPRGSGSTRPVAGLKALLEAVGLKLEATDGDDEAPVMNATVEMIPDEETDQAGAEAGPTDDAA
jgi:hypothetical protein